MPVERLRFRPVRRTTRFGRTVCGESRRAVDPARACIVLSGREAASALTLFADRLGCGGGNEFAYADCIEKIELVRGRAKAFSSSAFLHPHDCQLAQFGHDDAFSRPTWQLVE